MESTATNLPPQPQGEVKVKHIDPSERVRRNPGGPQGGDGLELCPEGWEASKSKKSFIKLLLPSFSKPLIRRKHL